jgi:hypothetical protein
MSNVKQLAHPGMLIVSIDRKCTRLFLCVLTKRDSLSIAISQSKFDICFTKPVVFNDEEILE